MARPERIKFEFRRYRSEAKSFVNDRVAQLPGLLITQFNPETALPGLDDDRVALRFDFTDDWYSVLAFLDEEKRPTGHYKICLQSPLNEENGIWIGDDLLLRLEIRPESDYIITGEEEFFSAVETGWMRVFSAAKAREALRKLCSMLDEGQLPQEVMDAVCG